MREQSTTKGFAILSAANIVVKLLSLIYNPLLVRILVGDQAFGIYNVTYQIYVLIYVLTNTGIPSAISKLVSEFSAVQNFKAAIKTFKMSRSLLLVIGIVMAVIMFFISGPVTTFMKVPQAKLSVIALCPAIIFTSVASAYRGYFQGRGNMKPTAISQILEQIMNTVFSLGFAAILIKKSMELGVVGATIGTTLGAMVSATYLFITYERTSHIKHKTSDSEVKHKKYTNKQIIRKIAKYGIPITISIGVMNAGTLADTTIIVNRLMFAGDTQANAEAIFGAYAKYITLINVPIAIISALAVAVLPAVAKAIALKDSNLAKRKITFAFKLCFLIAIPSAVGLSVLSRPIFLLLYSRYLNGYQIMLYGSVVLVLMSFQQIQTSILQGLGRLRIVTLYAIIGIIVKVVTDYILVANKNFNIYGAIIGSVLGFSVPIFLNHKYMLKTLKQKINLSQYILRPFIASVCMGVVAYIIDVVLSYLLHFASKSRLVDDFSTVIAIVIGGITYSVVILLIKGVSKEEVDILPGKIRRLIPAKFIQG